MGKGGKGLEGAMSATNALDVLKEPRFTPFLEDSFDAATFASRSLSADGHTTAQAQTEQLELGVAALDAALRQLVLRHQGELVAQTARLTEAEGAVQRLGLSVRSLQMVAARVRAEVAEPYQQIAARTQQLRNLQATVDLLRHATHRLKLVQRLRVQMGAADAAGILEVAKAAKLLSEIAAVDAEADLAGIDAVDADAEFLQTAAAVVRSQTEVALRAGLQCISQADVGSALQVLFNLNELQQAVLQLADQAAAAFGRDLGAALDPRKLSASSVAAGGASGGAHHGPGGAKSLGGPLPGSTAKVQEVLWEKLGAALDLLQRGAVEVWHVQRVLAKKRDPLTHALFIDVVAPSDADPLPLERFWSRAVAAAADCFAAAFSTARGGFVRDTLAGAYPRLAVLLEGVLARVLRDSAARDVAPAVDDAQAAALLEAAADFQNAYLAAALARLTEAATTAFPGTSRALPTAADLQKSIARVHEELKAAAGSPRLARLVAATAGQALRLMAQKAEYMSASGPDLRAVGGACTSAQLRNISLCNCLHEVHRSVAGMLGRLPPGAAEALAAPLADLQAAAVDAVAPMFRAGVEAGEELLLQMHGSAAYTGAPPADGGGGGGGGEPGMMDTSPYMRELARLLASLRLELLTKFNPAPTSPVPSVARALVERMSARLVLFAVRHASLLRPLPQAGKLQLAKDLAELEAAVGQHLLPLEQLGGPACALRAFRRLLFLDTPELEGSPLLRELPRPEVLHHLYSRAPPALESPHARSGLTPTQYSLWLDGHSQEAALKLVRTALDACAPHARGADGADALVDLMRRLCTA